jgi:hypothetical protein
VQAFDDFEKAMHWLSRADEAQVETEFTPVAKRVPVRKLETLKVPAKPVLPPVIQIKSKTVAKPGAMPPKAGKRTAAGRPLQASKDAAPVAPKQVWA